MKLRISFIFLLYVPFVTFGQTTEGMPDINLGTVWFKGESIKLTKDAKATLDTFITQIRQNPKMSVQAIAFNKDFCDKCAVRSIKRAKAVLTYLSQHGVTDDRLTYTNRLQGELNKVDIVLTSLTMSNEPHPSTKRDR